MTPASRDRGVAREISYASSASTRAGRVVIRTVENLTGRPGLIRRALGYEDYVARGRDFWEVMIDRYGLDLELGPGHARAGDAGALMDFLRAETYRLSPKPIADLGYGFDFEEAR